MITTYHPLGTFMKRSLFGLMIWLGHSVVGQQCPTISYPLEGAVDVPVGATITWPEVSDITSYIISLGTTPGGTDILNRRSLGLVNSYTAPVGLPENTRIYVSLTLIPLDQRPVECGGVSFTTVDVTTPPPCTILVAPDNNASNVTIVSDIIWAYAETATGYRLSMGTVPGGVDILDNLDVGNVLSYEPPSDLPQDTKIFVRITTSNENGDSATCMEEFFITGPAPFDCEVLDEQTGQIVSLKPVIELPDQVRLCIDELPHMISTNALADGFRWFRVDSGSNSETLLSETRDAVITAAGRYRLEAYNYITRDTRILECSDSKLFTVLVFEPPVIDRIERLRRPAGVEITVYVEGNGDFEFALDNAEGPFRPEPVFYNVGEGMHTAYVREKNGCGAAERMTQRNLNVWDFPKFFSPNGDGVNDFWQLVPPIDDVEMDLKTIFVFDRLGGLVGQIDPESVGWDGNFQGKPLPSSDYWFKAVSFTKPEIKGHFTLKR